MDESSERPGDHLPWVRDNDRMPGRAASSYVRIPVEIAKAPPPPADEPGDATAEPAPSAPPETPAPAPAPESPADGRRRPGLRTARQRVPEEPRRVEPGPWVMPSLPLSAAMPGLLALLGFFLASVALATAAGMVLLPASARTAAAIVAALFLGLLAYPAGRWALALSGRSLLRLESFEDFIPVRSATLAAIARRAELRSRASDRSPGVEPIPARDVLGRFLASHPIGDGSDARAWSDLGISAEVRDALKRRKDDLLSPRRLGSDEAGSPGDWLRSFEEGFLQPLDDSALRRVEEHAWRAFKATASSPNGGVDAMVTLSSGSAMLEELGRIYDLRMGRVGAAVLLLRLLADNDLAGRPDRPDARAEAVDQGEMTDEIPSEGGFRAALSRHPIPPAAPEIAALLDRGARAYGLRAESGLLNYFLMRGLGDRAIGLLRPMTRR